MARKNQVYDGVTMDTECGRTSVSDSKALAALTQLEQLEQRGLRVDMEIYLLLAPLKDELRALVLEHERLVFESLDARRGFFQAAKRADTSLRAHGGLRYEKEGEEVYVAWDDAGPLFSDHERAEPPRFHSLKRRGPGRRAFDLTRWLT